MFAIPILKGTYPSSFLSFGSDPGELSYKNQEFISGSGLWVLGEPMGSLTNDVDQTTLDLGLWPNLINRL